MRRVRVATPVGPFTIVTDEDGRVLASGWTSEVGDLLPLIAPALRDGSPRECRDLGAVTRAVGDYFAGELEAIDGVKVNQRSGPFLEEAWDRLREVAPGAPVTYAELAAQAGRPGAARAAASACARNAAALFVPCHRVVRTGGALGGFRWGLEVKRGLLAHEGGSSAGGLFAETA